MFSLYRKSKKEFDPSSQQELFNFDPSGAVTAVDLDSDAKYHNFLFNKYQRDKGYMTGNLRDINTMKASLAPADFLQAKAKDKKVRDDLIKNQLGALYDGFISIGLSDTDAYDQASKAIDYFAEIQQNLHNTIYPGTATEISMSHNAPRAVGRNVFGVKKGSKEIKN